MIPFQHELNLSGLNCPLPILKTKKALSQMHSGELLQVSCTDPAAPSDFVTFCEQTQNPLVKQWKENDTFFFLIRRR